MTLDALHDIVDRRCRRQRDEHARAGRFVAFGRMRRRLDALPLRVRLQSVREPVVDAVRAGVERRMRRVDSDAPRGAVQQRPLQRIVLAQRLEPAEDRRMVGLNTSDASQRGATDDDHASIRRQSVEHSASEVDAEHNLALRLCSAHSVKQDACVIPASG